MLKAADNSLLTWSHCYNAFINMESSHRLGDSMIVYTSTIMMLSQFSNSLTIPEFFPPIIMVHIQNILIGCTNRVFIKHIYRII